MHKSQVYIQYVNSLFVTWLKTLKKLRSWHPVPILHGKQMEQIGETMETVTDFIFLGSKITADGDYSHQIKRCLLLGRKVTTNLDSVLKSRDISLPTKVHLVKAWFLQQSCMDVIIRLKPSLLPHPFCWLDLMESGRVSTQGKAKSTKSVHCK